MSRPLRSAAVAGALTLLTGCQTPLTSKSIVDEGSRSEHALRQEPHRAAVCMARNIDRNRRELTAHIRQGSAPALVEVDVRAERLVALARFLVSEEGSVALIWIDPRDANEALLHVMIDGC
jgi:hypothetical protein